MLTTTNPLSSSRNILSSSRENAVADAGVFSLRGACFKSVFLTALCFAGAVAAYAAPLAYSAGYLPMIMLFVSLGAYFAGLFAPSAAKFCAPVYAACEGVLLGCVSAVIDARYGRGLSVYAMLGTISVAGIIFTGYATGLFRVTRTLVKFALIAGGALVVSYLAALLLPFLGLGNFLAPENVSPLGFGINALAVVIGAIYLLIDFQQVFDLEGRADRRYEWVWAMGFLASLVWLYIEILRLAARIAVLTRE